MKIRYQLHMMMMLMMMRRRKVSLMLVNVGGWWDSVSGSNIRQFVRTSLSPAARWDDVVEGFILWIIVWLRLQTWIRSVQTSLFQPNCKKECKNVKYCSTCPSKPTGPVTPVGPPAPPPSGTFIIGPPAPPDIFSEQSIIDVWSITPTNTFPHDLIPVILKKPKKYFWNSFYLNKLKIFTKCGSIFSELCFSVNSCDLTINMKYQIYV